MNTSSLSAGERLLIDRRRKGESQRQAAKRLGVSLYRYRRWERSEEQPPKLMPLGMLKLHEKCFLTRRRADVPAHVVALELGVSDEWLTQMEYGRQPCQKLAVHLGLLAANAVC